MQYTTTKESSTKQITKQYRQNQQQQQYISKPTIKTNP